MCRLKTFLCETKRSYLMGPEFIVKTPKRIVFHFTLSPPDSLGKRHFDNISFCVTLTGAKPMSIFCQDLDRPELTPEKRKRFQVKPIVLRKQLYFLPHLYYLDCAGTSFAKGMFYLSSSLGLGQTRSKIGINHKIFNLFTSLSP